ncbi:MAG TPA: bifunctional DNA primase/polymerase, partial [Ktedonobacterales bacterium]|nr:bifunctional DNA primase/polymerase [Ktedonobacterales bacterium]
MTSPLEAAIYYTRERGWHVIPVPAGTKIPVLKAWQKLCLDVADLDQYIKGDANLGRLNGEPSGGYVDADFDVPEALEAATKLMPSTGLVSGRPGNPRSHWHYISDDCKTHQYEDVAAKGSTSGEMLLELRSTGTQTLL